MSKNKNIKNVIKHLLLVLIMIVGYSQLTVSQSITGPTCITPGVQYSYNIVCGSTFTYDVTGGVLSTGGTHGTHAPPHVVVLITWNSGSISRGISLGAPGIDIGLGVVTTSAVAGGAITSGQTQNINYNTMPASIGCAAATGGACTDPAYNYQWQQSPDNVTFTNIAGATIKDLTLSSSLIQTTYYRRFVTETVSGTSAYSNVATITVYPILDPGSVGPATQTINYNTNASVLTLSGVSGGTNSYSYQWQTGTDPYTFTDIAGIITSTYTPTGLTGTKYYRVAVTSNAQTLYTNSVAVFVNPQLLPGVISPTYIPITSGTSPGGLTGTPASYGSCGGSYAYQWLSSTNGTSFATVSGATSQNYTPGNLSANTWYTRKVTCNTVTAYTDTIKVVIVSGTPDINFVRVRDIQKAGILDSAAALALTSPFDVTQTTQYFDGLRRQIETVGMQQSPLQKDMVSFNVYDVLGRESQKYLPYVASTNDGNYKQTALADNLKFNATQFPGEQYYYSKTDYEPSPLNRVTATFAPGNSWVGAGRSANVQYLVNTAADSVRYWKIAFTAGSMPTTTSIYAAGTLYENVTTDEAGHSVVEYKDMEGKVVLKKVQLAASPGTAHVGWLCTYYIYDDLNNLRFVIQPKAVQLINSNWTITTAIAGELCFRYEYDPRKRMIIKKIPGAGEVWMVYDLRDRLVMTQDSSLRLNHKWMFIDYDSQNRPDSTGLITDPTNYNKLAYHQSRADTSSNYPVVSSYTNELLTQTYYDDYNWVSGTGSGLSSSVATGYSGNSTYFLTTYNTSPNYSQPLTLYNLTRGMVTGTKTKVIGTSSQYLYNVSSYDDRGRTIQSQSVNYTGGLQNHRKPVVLQCTHKFLSTGLCSRLSSRSHNKSQ